MALALVPVVDSVLARLIATPKQILRLAALKIVTKVKIAFTKKVIRTALLTKTELSVTHLPTVCLANSVLQTLVRPAPKELLAWTSRSVTVLVKQIVRSVQQKIVLFARLNTTLSSECACSSVKLVLFPRRKRTVRAKILSAKRGANAQQKAANALLEKSVMAIQPLF